MLRLVNFGFLLVDAARVGMTILALIELQIRAAAERRMHHISVGSLDPVGTRRGVSGR